MFTYVTVTKNIQLLTCINHLMKPFACIICLSIAFTLQAQEKKAARAFPVSTPLTIDGILDEPAYSQATPAKDFMQLQPYNGKPSFQPSEVYIFYDQTAIYVGAMLYDSAPDSIYNFFSERDNIGASDYFGIYFDPYNQGQLAYGFFITPSGSQTDLKAIKAEYDNEYSNWNAVWQSKTRITDKGWVVEMRIPYAALRFPENGGGTWGLNIFRNIRRYNSNNSWNFLNREVAGFIHQEGQLYGIVNIKPPVRLSLSPYAAAYEEFQGENSSPDFTYKYGLDLKYGISEGFTLDMMLVPDFGQIQSDDKQLNLTPFEIFYDEKRQFFTEGTELFQRGDIFYSRRIGTTPFYSENAGDAVEGAEKVIYNPTETQLINATKVSGRTTSGWGLGMLNAMTLPSYAKLRDSITNADRTVMVQPFTNYNVAVVDKSLKNNSYISLINTNMSMANDPFHANVTATDFQIRNKKKTFAVSGKGGISTRNENGAETGYFSYLGLDKNSGKVRFGISESIHSDKYNPNDMGYLQHNNDMVTETYGGYHIIEPFSIFRELHLTLWWDHMRMYRHNLLYANMAGLNSFALFKNNYEAELYMRFIGDMHDYYEPRVEDRYFLDPYRYRIGGFVGTDSRKAFRIDADLGGTYVFDMDQRRVDGDINFRLRVGKRSQFSYSFMFSNNMNDRGYVDNTESGDTIYFAKRDVKVIENNIEASYSFTNNATLGLRVRHYWSGAANKEYFQLNQDGTLMPDPAYTENQDQNFNAFNIDLIFRWIFAPGSELTLAWKNSILDDGDAVNTHYFENLSNTWQQDQVNSFSIKILYYIDYNSVFKHK